MLAGPGTPTRRRILYGLGGVGGLFVAFFVLLFLYALLLIPFTPGISDLRKAKAERPTIVLSADGEKLIEFKPFHREWVELDDIAPEVVRALIDTEDHRFYHHHGVDFRRTLGALLNTLRGNTQGGSTITQQLARNLYPDEIGRQQSLTRKIKEAITAFKIEYAYSKDEILETYLNTVPFFFNAYGIEMAARTYFSKPASDLTLLQAATLVGMLKGTAYYNPVRNPERARSRRNVVLGQMVKYGDLSQDKFERLQDEPLRLDFERQVEKESQAPHFIAHLRGWLIDWADRNGYNIYRDSLVVHTTLDTRVQRLAQRSVDRWMPALQAVAELDWSREQPVGRGRSLASFRGRDASGQDFDYLWESRPELLDQFVRETPQYRAGVAAGVPEAEMLDSLRHDETFMQALRALKTRLEVGFVAMDPENGYVRAWVGSSDFDVDQYDHVARARRQPGSTFKPIVYAAALEDGWTPSDTLRDRIVEIHLKNGEVWSPTNEGSVSGKEFTLADALAYSKNTITAQLIQDVGTGDVVRLARRLGVRESPLEEVPSIALGTSAVTLLEMVTAYSTLADEGVYHEPVMVTEIDDKNGDVIATFGADPHRVLSEETALGTIDMMRGVVDRGTGHRVRTTFGIRADVAAKTGTTQDNTDGWFIMMYPKLVAGAWVGFNDPRVAFRSDYWGQGGNNALYIVGDFFRQALSSSALDLRGERFPPPSEYEAQTHTFFGRVGHWFDQAFQDVGVWVVDALDSAGDVIFGGGQEEQTAPENGRTSPGEQPGTDVYAPSDGTQIADSLNRMERDSTQLRQMIDRIRSQRQAEEPPPAPTQPLPDTTAAPTLQPPPGPLNP